ncbi:FkbM family methyltransferase [Mycobacteroides salmoniphilum]|uniref:FkbM family methyltransferase n=1 Tax=Mycobacteroides salmoniphilum TaxID=404941 RepID=UPI000993957B|nr:FkbM family methyltransferase [Mycobacteroides salmoniphilum]
MPALRLAQTYLPFLRPLKFGAYNMGTRLLGWRIDPEFHLLSRLGPLSEAVDIGGNWGQSICALQRTASPERIVSFEPNAVLAQRLRRRYESSTVCVHACGLSDADGTFDLFVPRYRNFVYDGLASLDEGEARGWLNSETMAGFDESKLTIERHPVQVRRLDDFGLDPQVIKIDVQGMEAAVIRGGLVTIADSRPVMIIETPSDQVVSLLQPTGLRPYAYRDGQLSQNWRDAKNTVFLTDSHRDRAGL